MRRVIYLYARHTIIPTHQTLVHSMLAAQRRTHIPNGNEIIQMWRQTCNCCNWIARVNVAGCRTMCTAANAILFQLLPFRIYRESFAIASTVNELLISRKHCGVEKRKNREEPHAMTDIAANADHQLRARFLTLRSFLHLLIGVVLILHAAKLWLRRCFLSRYGHAIRIASPHISIHVFVFCWCWQHCGWEWSEPD